jgi:hypothetical protein
LARLALQRLDGDPVAAAADALTEHALEQVREPIVRGGREMYVPFGAMAAQLLCGTSALRPG